MVIRNAAILQAIFIANIVRHVQLPLSNLHGSPIALDRLPGFLQGGISADKPPAVFWHRRTGTNAQRVSGSVASRHAGKLFGERENDLVARPSPTEREGSSVALSEAPLISFVCLRTMPNDVSTPKIDSQQRALHLNNTDDLVTRPFIAELKGDPPLAYHASGPPGYIPPFDYILEVSPEYTNTVFGTRSEVMSGNRNLPIMVTDEIHNNGSFAPRSTTPIEDISESFSGQGWLVLLLEVLVFLVDLSFADVYIPWLCRKLHPQRREETRTFLYIISALQDKIFEESFNMFPSTRFQSRQLLLSWVQMKHIAFAATLGQSIRLAYSGIENYTRSFVSSPALSIFSYTSLSSYSISRLPEICHLWLSCLRRILYAVAVKANELACQTGLLLAVGGMRLKEGLMTKFQVCRGIRDTGCKAILRQLRDKAMHRITITIANLGPLRRCYVFLFQSCRVLWEIIASAFPSKILSTGSVRVEPTVDLDHTTPSQTEFGQDNCSHDGFSFQPHTCDNSARKAPGRSGVYMPPNKRPGAKRYTEKLEPQSCTLAQLGAWQEERDFGHPTNHSALNPLDVPLPVSPMSPRVDVLVCDTPTIPSWRPDRYCEPSYSSIGLGRPRSLQFLRDHRAPLTDADTAPSWRRSDNAGTTEDPFLNRRASLDFQTLKRRAQCKTFIEVLPTLLANDDGTKSASRSVSWGPSSSVKDSERLVKEGIELSEHPVLEPAFDLKSKDFATAQRMLVEDHELTAENIPAVPPVSKDIELFVSPSNITVQKSHGLPLIEEDIISSDGPLAENSKNAHSLEANYSPAVHEQHQSRKYRSHRETRS